MPKDRFKNRALPRLEALEDRLMPHTYTWTSAGSDNLWSTQANWKDENNNQGVPGAADSAFINGAYDPVVNSGSLTQVGQLNVTISGTHALTLNTDLAVVGLSGASADSSLTSGKVSLDGGGLYLEMPDTLSHYTFDWQNGTISFPASINAGHVGVGNGARLLIASTGATDQDFIGCDVTVGQAADGTNSTGLMEVGGQRNNAVWTNHITGSTTRTITVTGSGTLSFTATSGSDTSGIATDGTESNKNNVILVQGGGVAQRTALDTGGKVVSVAAKLDVEGATALFDLGASATIYFNNASSTYTDSVYAANGDVELDANATLQVDRNVTIGNGGSGNAVLLLTPATAANATTQIQDMTTTNPQAQLSLEAGGAISVRNDEWNEFVTLSILGMDCYLDGGQVNLRVIGGTGTSCDFIDVANGTFSVSVDCSLGITSTFLTPGSGTIYTVLKENQPAIGQGKGSGDFGSVTGGGNTWSAHTWNSTAHLYQITAT